MNTKKNVDSTGRIFSEQNTGAERQEHIEKGRNAEKKGNADKIGNAGMALKQRRKNLTIWTKYLLDFMFYAGIVVTVTLPVSVKLIGQQLPYMIEHYEETVIIYFVLGVSASVLLRELRKIFKTVLEENCFVTENVVSLQKMGNWSFFIAVMSIVRSIVYWTIAMSVVIFVFMIAGLFSKVLAYVFEEAVQYKQENDLTV